MADGQKKKRKTQRAAQRAEKRRGGRKRAKGKARSTEEGRVWEKVGSVANPTLSHKGNPCLVHCLIGPEIPAKRYPLSAIVLRRFVVEEGALWAQRAGDRGLRKSGLLSEHVHHSSCHLCHRSDHRNNVPSSLQCPPLCPSPLCLTRSSWLSSAPLTPGPDLTITYPPSLHASFRHVTAHKSEQVLPGTLMKLFHTVLATFYLGLHINTCLVFRRVVNGPYGMRMLVHSIIKPLDKCSTVVRKVRLGIASCDSR
jgi:hypothetical protein